MLTEQSCSLCRQNNTQLFHQHKKRIYRHCAGCDLIFVPEEHHVNPEEEKSQYDFHENDPSHQGYKEFLSKLVTPLKEHLKPGMQGLDIVQRTHFKKFSRLLLHTLSCVNFHNRAIGCRQCSISIF